MRSRIDRLGFTALQSCVLLTTVSTMGAVALVSFGDASQQAIEGVATSANSERPPAQATPTRVSGRSLGGGARVAAKAAQVAQDIAQAVDGPYKRIPASTTPRPIPAKFAQLRQVLDGIKERADLSPQRQVTEAVQDVFGQSSGADLFAAALEDIRQSIGVRLFEEVQIGSKLDRGDTNSRLVLALGEIAKGQTTSAQKTLDEIEQIYDAGESNFRVQSALLERLRVLTVVFDDSRRVNPARIAEVFEGKLRTIPSIASDGPSNDLLRTLERYDGRTSRYDIERTRRLYATDERFGTELPGLDEKANRFLIETFERDKNRVRDLLEPGKLVRAEGPKGGKSRQLTPTPLIEIELAVRRGNTEAALEALEELRDDLSLFRGGDTLDRAEALDQLESAIITVAPRFVPADQYFPARFRGQRFDLTRPPRDLPAPVLRLSEKLQQQIAFKRGIKVRRGFTEQDLQDALSEVFRASIRGDEDAIKPKMRDIRTTILSQSDDFDLLEQDLVEFARLFREGRDRLGERRLNIVDDRNLPKELQEPASRLAIELAEGLSRAE